MKLTLLFGGNSYEHEISIVSAITLRKVLKNFELTFIFLDTDHTLYLIDSDKMMAKTFSSKVYKKMSKLSFVKSGFELKGVFKRELFSSPVLNVIHGADGEDGTIAALLEFYNIRYIGPRKAASSISVDKELTKMYSSGVGVKSLPYERLHRDGERSVNIKYPLIVKPAKLGSSIGVSIVKEDSGLDYALDVAFEFDERVIVEPFIEGVKEYNLAGCRADEYIFSTIEEPQKEEFLDFDKKYRDFARDEQVRGADIEKSLTLKLEEAFKLVYNNYFEGSIIRCDFFVIDDEVYLNEINPIPGSMANYLFENFENSLIRVLGHLPEKKEIPIAYEYIHSINSAKGK